MKVKVMSRNTLSRKAVIHKLLEIKQTFSLPLSKQKAIYKAITDVNYRIADDCKVEEKPVNMFVNYGDKPHELKTIMLKMYVCPACGTGIREVNYHGMLNKPFPKFCSECGKALKAPS